MVYGKRGRKRWSEMVEKDGREVRSVRCCCLECHYLRYASKPRPTWVLYTVLSVDARDSSETATLAMLRSLFKPIYADSLLQYLPLYAESLWLRHCDTRYEVCEEKNYCQAYLR